MAKIRIIVCVLAVLFAASCGKKTPPTLSGTNWGTSIMQVNVLLSFTSETNGVLRVTGNLEGAVIDETVTFTYTYANPNVLMHPTNPPYTTEYPNGIKATVHGSVMDFSDFFDGEEITLTKK